ncbi:ATP-dependent sacrificial sulfur transferase LarE [Tepidibacter aestuarii]|uniref:ATP-dependent sacrificial sulfur transferase LarE n=1 Tax=Tepidibacter aestuarii TaxID=2925782 RepID=UPI0020BDD3FB|nr:ATP-dependent sacrificial sulfur transferase LarE [Tepidibacter aestuarii]CAH2213672.1 putative Pyridinium-3,5-bisthiocarboxylic acid mononucleotide synthase [Tepidibacter aestuarii]CAH2215677.1 putative Pyridinium-3,5-bisthiocarboxylic acid mononucleotide synthase [Tepidibacter aestuarii]
MTAIEKLKVLKNNLSKLDNLTVAFSGGVDSTFLLKIAQDVLREKVLAVTVNAFIHTNKEIQESIDYANEINIKHIVLNINDINIKEFIDNVPERCYFCKKDIFTKIKKVSNENDINNIADGSNIDDLSDFRPGMKALKELGIISPLKEAGLTKQDIRDLSKMLNIPTWNKPSFACLASRIPYNHKITPKKLNMIEKSEEYISQLGFKQFRVRHHGEIARIELKQDEILNFLESGSSNKVCEYLKSLGFNYVTIDLLGYRTGSMNEVL